MAAIVARSMAMRPYGMEGKEAQAIGDIQDDLEVAHPLFCLSTPAVSS